MIEKVGFILSTGRTGTQFFEEFLSANFKNTLCLQEPKPSRRFKFYSNLLSQNKISENFVSKQYLKLRKKILNTNNLKLYVESNNFIFGCINAFRDNISNIYILHLIRHPEKYIISHLNHGFWGGYKKLSSCQ